MAALLTADIQALAHHGLNDVAVTDLRAKDPSSLGGQCFIEAKIAHDRCDQGVRGQPPRLQEREGGNRHDLVTIHKITVFVAEKHAIRVTVMGDSNMSLRLFDSSLDLGRMRAAAVCVDICAIRGVVNDISFGTEFSQNARSGFVSGAVCAIDSNSQRIQRSPARKALFGKFDIAPQSVVDAEGLADLRRGWPDVFDLSAENNVFDALFDFVVELVAVVAEELYSIIFVGVV